VHFQSSKQTRSEYTYAMMVHKHTNFTDFTDFTDFSVNWLL